MGGPREARAQGTEEASQARCQGCTDRRKEAEEGSQEESSRSCRPCCCRTSCSRQGTRTLWGSSYLSNKVESTPGNFARLKEAEITANRCGFVKEPIKSDADKPSSTYKLQFSDAQLNGMSYPSSLSSSLSS